MLERPFDFRTIVSFTNDNIPRLRSKKPLVKGNQQPDEHIRGRAIARTVDRRAQWSRLAEDLSNASFWGSVFAYSRNPNRSWRKRQKAKTGADHRTHGLCGVNLALVLVCHASLRRNPCQRHGVKGALVRPSRLRVGSPTVHVSSIPLFNSPPTTVSCPAIDCCSIIIDDSPALLCRSENGQVGTSRHNSIAVNLAVLVTSVLTSWQPKKYNRNRKSLPRSYNNVPVTLARLVKDQLEAAFESDSPLLMIALTKLASAVFLQILGPGCMSEIACDSHQHVLCCAVLRTARAKVFPAALKLRVHNLLPFRGNRSSISRCTSMSIMSLSCLLASLIERVELKGQR